MDFPTGNKRLPKFPWGYVVEVHEIGDFDLIIEHHPEIFNGCTGTGCYEKTKVMFTLAAGHRNDPKHISWESYETLDKAILAALAHKYTEGAQAAQYAGRVLGLPE